MGGDVYVKRALLATVAHAGGNADANTTYSAGAFVFGDAASVFKIDGQVFAPGNDNDVTTPTIRRMLCSA